MYVMNKLRREIAPDLLDVRCATALQSSDQVRRAFGLRELLCSAERM